MSGKDEILLSIGRDGVVRQYDSTYDITIHCESEAEQKRVAELLKSIGKKAANWISCSQKMPEEDEDVLIQLPHNMVTGFWSDTLEDGKRCWYAYSGDGCYTDTDYCEGYDEPVAWMPLPEEYKEAKSEDEPD